MKKRVTENTHTYEDNHKPVHMTSYYPQEEEGSIKSS
jgi:hypothetical protein